MIIKNREELAVQLNNYAVETFPGECKPGRKMMNTIVYNKQKDKFYKIEWGEITDENKVNFLWFDEEAKEVLFNPKGKDGWFTKEQIKTIDIVKGDNYMEMSRILSNVETNIVNLGELKPDQLTGLDLSEVELIGAKSGKGKTWYAMKKTVEAMAKDETVLFFSTETSTKEIVDRLRRVIVETDIVKGLWKNAEAKTKEERDVIALEFIQKSKIIIDNSYSIDTNYIIDKMKKTSVIYDLKFVVVDSLKMTLDPKMRNTIQVQNVIGHLEDAANECKCRMLVTTQLNSNY